MVRHGSGLFLLERWWRDEGGGSVSSVCGGLSRANGGCESRTVTNGKCAGDLMEAFLCGEGCAGCSVCVWTMRMGWLMVVSYLID